MPSPFAHAVAATLLAKTMLQRNPFASRRTATWALSLLFSFAPDMDALPGLWHGDLPGYHNQITHSLLFGLACCLLTAPLLDRMLLGPGWKYSCRLALYAYGLHIFMDWMTRGRGVMLAWPFSSNRFAMVPSLFSGLRWSEGLFSPHHLETLANETLITGLILVLAWIFLLLIRRTRY